MPVEAKAHEITRPQGSAAIRQPLLRDVADQPVAAAHWTTEQLDRAAGERLGAEMARSRLVLPAPFGPSTATNSPEPTLRLRCDQRVREPNVRLASLTDRIGGTGGVTGLRPVRGGRGHGLSAPDSA